MCWAAGQGHFLQDREGHDGLLLLLVGVAAGAALAARATLARSRLPIPASGNSIGPALLNGHPNNMRAWHFSGAALSPCCGWSWADVALVARWRFAYVQRLAGLPQQLVQRAAGVDGVPGASATSIPIIFQPACPPPPPNRAPSLLFSLPIAHCSTAYLPLQCCNCPSGSLPICLLFSWWRSSLPCPSSHPLCKPTRQGVGRQHQ